MAVITNSNTLQAAVLQINMQLRGLGIQTVFQQLFNNRCGALNHLARGDLIDQVIGELLNGHTPLSHPIAAVA